MALACCSIPRLLTPAGIFVKRLTVIAADSTGEFARTFRLLRERRTLQASLVPDYDTWKSSTRGTVHSLFTRASQEFLSRVRRLEYPQFCFFVGRWAAHGRQPLGGFCPQISYCGGKNSAGWRSAGDQAEENSPLPLHITRHSSPAVYAEVP